MEIVIDIDKNVFTRLFDNVTEDYQIVNDDLFAIAKSIRKGTPLKTGHWIGVNPMVDTLMCSECGENIISEDFKSNYCPNCGARMGEDEE